MRTYAIRWSGIITRDLGIDYIEAEDEKAAEQYWKNAHNGHRRIDWIIPKEEVEERNA